MPENVKSLIREFFLRRGCKELDDDRLREVDLAFECDGYVVGVDIVEAKGRPSKIIADIRGRMYKALKNRNFDYYYIVVPELRWHYLPAPSEFKVSGVGLLEVFNGNVEERISAKLLRDDEEKARWRKTETSDDLVNDLAEKVSEILKSDLSILVRETVEAVLREEIRQLESEVSKLIERINRLERLVSRGTSAQPSPGHKYEVARSEKLLEESVPEFIRSNPWIGIISKRRELQKTVDQSR